VLLVIGFKSSSNLASAYGLAVSGVMVVTTLSMIVIAHENWRWGLLRSLTLFGGLAIIDFTFLFANSLKIFQGGYVPLTIGLAILAIMKSWNWGRRYVNATYEQAKAKAMTVKELIALKKKTTCIMPRSMVIMTPERITSINDQVPFLKQIFWDRYGMMPQDLLFLTVTTQRQPHCGKQRYAITKLFNSKTKGSITAVEIYFGFMEEVNVETILLELAHHQEIKITTHPNDWLIHVVQERIYVEHIKNWLRKIQFVFFSFLLKNAESADQYFGIGKDVRLTIEAIPVRIKA